MRMHAFFRELPRLYTSPGRVRKAAGADRASRSTGAPPHSARVQHTSRIAAHGLLFRLFSFSMPEPPVYRLSGTLIQFEEIKAPDIGPALLLYRLPAPLIHASATAPIPGRQRKSSVPADPGALLI